MEYETPITSSQVPADDDQDYEKYGANRDSNPMPDLKRKLKSRHLQMIAIGELHALLTPDLSRSQFSLFRWYNWNWSLHR